MLDNCNGLSEEYQMRMILTSNILRAENKCIIRNLDTVQFMLHPIGPDRKPDTKKLTQVGLLVV